MWGRTWKISLTDSRWPNSSMDTLRTQILQQSTPSMKRDQSRWASYGSFWDFVATTGSSRIPPLCELLSVPIESFGWDQPRLPWKVEKNSAGCTCSPTAPLPDNHGSRYQLIEELLDVLIKPQTCAWSAYLERLLESSNRKLLNTT